MLCFRLKEFIILRFPELTSDKIFAKSYWNSFPIFKLAKACREQGLQAKKIFLKLSFYALTLVDSICRSPSQGYSSTPHGQRPPHLQ